MDATGNVATIKTLYDEFGRGNVDAILSRLSDDVHWEEFANTDIPYAGKRQGKPAVREFFNSIGEQINVTAFEPQEFIAVDDRVIVCGQWAGKVRATGKSFQSRWAMFWTFKGEKVVRFMCYEDTASTAAAFRK